jgi:TP901 family phage tail tape measure protein
VAASAIDLLIAIQAKDEASRVLGGVGSAISALGIGAVAAGGAMAAGLAVGIKSAGDLEQAVANISTIKPQIDTSQVFSQLNEISTRVPQSAKELGDGLYNIFSSLDVSQEQAIGLVETFAKGAVGASTDAATFGTAAVGVMNAYGLAAEDAGHISDVFFNTVNKGVVTGTELAGNLGLVTQSAKLAGVDLDSLGGFIAGVTKEGGNAAQNMNNLSNLFQKITTKEATAAFHDLGIATADATGAFRPQIDVLADLKQATAGMTEEARIAAIQKIFPDVQARAGAAVIMDQLDFVRGAIEENKAATGSAAAAYEKMSATFNAQSKLLGNAFTAILTTIGGSVLPAITPLITAFAKDLPIAFEGFKGIALAFSTDAGGMGIALDAVRKIFGDTVANAIEPFVNAFMRAIPAIKAFAADPLAAVQKALATVQAQFVAFAPTGERIGAAFDIISTAVMGLVATGQGLVAEFMASGTAAAATSGAMDALVAAVNALSAGFAGVTKFIQDNVAAQAVLVAGLTAAATIWGLMTAAAIAHAVAVNAVATATAAYTAVQWLLNAALTANPIGIVIVALAAFAAALIYAYNNSEEFRAVVDAAFAAVVAAGAALLAFVQSLPATIQGALSAAGEAFSTFGSDVQATLGAIGNFFSNIGTQTQAGLAGIGDFFSGMGTVVRSGLDTVGSSVGAFFDGLGSTVQSGLAAIAGFFSTMWNAVPDDIRSDLAIVLGLVGDHFSDLGTIVQTGMTLVGDTFTAGWTAATDAATAAMLAIATAVNDGWNAITTAVGTAMTSVSAAVQDGWGLVSAAVGGAMSALGTVVQDGWAAISTVTGTVIGEMIGDVQTGWDTITAAASAAWDGINVVIGAALAAALAVVSNWASDVLAKITGLAGEMQGAGRAAGQAAVDGLRGALEGGIRAIGDAAANLARSALNSAKEALGAHSPSAEFAALGGDAADGLVLGLKSKDPAVKAAAQELARQAQIAVQVAAPVDSFLVVGQDMGEGIALGLLRGVDKAKTAAGTYGDSILGELQSFTHKVDGEIQTATNRLADIASAAGKAVQSAMDKESDAIDASITKMQSSLESLYATHALDTDTSARKGALADTIRDETLAHDQVAAATELAYQHTRELSKAQFKFDSDIAKATTDVKKQALTQQYDEQVASLNASYADAQAAAAHRQELAAADRAFKASEDAKTKALDDTLAGEALARQVSTIIAGQAAAAAAAAQASTDAQQAAQLSADAQRVILLRSYDQRIDDLKVAFLDKIPELEGPALEAFTAFMDNINAQTAAMGATVAGSMGAAATTIRDTFVTAVPDALGVTDQAVEAFADQWHVSWDDARATLMAGASAVVEGAGKHIPAALESAASSAHRTLGTGGAIPNAARVSAEALNSVGSAAGSSLTGPLNLLKDAAAKLGSGGLAVAAEAAKNLEGQFPGLTDAVNAWIATLGGIPASVTTDIITNFVTKGTPSGPGGAAAAGGGGKSGGPVDFTRAETDQPYRDQLRDQGYLVGREDGKLYVEKRASGGPVRAGMPYFVGERGPELFTPQQSGSISPNGGWGGGGMSRADARMIAEELARAIETLPAPRVAVEDIRTSLIGIGQRNGGIVGLA